jgi:hypothetical protein
MRHYYDFVIQTDRGNRDAMNLIAQIVDWTEKNQVTAFLNKVVPAQHEPEYANEFDIHLHIEDDEDAVQKFQAWCDENANSLWAFHSYKVSEVEAAE